MTPGVQGAVLRGKTALVLTHSNGLFAWYLTLMISFLFLCMLDKALSCIIYPNIRGNELNLFFSPAALQGE